MGHRWMGLVGVCVGMAALNGVAAVRLPNIFGDNMVLQQGMAVPVWGWADPGEKVTVRFAGQTLQATADRNGAWRVALGALSASSAPISSQCGFISLSMRERAAFFFGRRRRTFSRTSEMPPAFVWYLSARRTMSSSEMIFPRRNLATPLRQMAWRCAALSLSKRME